MPLTNPIQWALRKMLLTSEGEATEKVGTIAARMNRAAVTLYQWAEHPDRMSVMEVPALTAASGSSLLIDTLNDLCKEARSRRRPENVQGRLIPGMLKEVAEVVEAASDALMDGHVSSSEAEGVAKEGEEAIAKIRRVMDAVAAMAAEREVSDGRVVSLADTVKAKKG